MSRVLGTGPNDWLVFASNKAGRHGKGSALLARQKYGAIYGRGIGPQGRSYAIPTKDYDVYTRLSISQIKPFVADFIAFSIAHPEITFWVVKIGCGESKYTDEEMAPLLVGAPQNCKLPERWRAIAGGTTTILRESEAGRGSEEVPGVKQS